MILMFNNNFDLSFSPNFVMGTDDGYWKRGYPVNDGMNWTLRVTLPDGVVVNAGDVYTMNVWPTAKRYYCLRGECVKTEGRDAVFANMCDTTVQLYTV